MIHHMVNVDYCVLRLMVAFFFKMPPKVGQNKITMYKLALTVNIFNADFTIFIMESFSPVMLKVIKTKSQAAS